MTSDALSNQAALRYEQARFDDSLRFGVQAAAAAARSVGESSPFGGLALQAQGRALVELGRPAEALPLLLRSITIFEQAENPESRSLVDSLEAAAAACLALKQPGRARPMAERALAILDKHCAKSGQRAQVRFRLAQALAAEHQDPAQVDALVGQAREELAPLAWKKWKLEQLEAWQRSRRR